MKRRLLLFMPLALAVLLGTVFFYGLGRDPSVLESARLDDPFPEFRLPALSDPEQMLDQSLLKGRTRLVNVWATWCPSCVVEHPYLVALAEQGVPIVGLNYKDERDKALAWLREKGDPYTRNIFDRQGKLGFDLGVYGAPETYIVDARGVVRHRHVGVVNERVWEGQMKPVFERYARQEEQ